MTNIKRLLALAFLAVFTASPAFATYQPQNPNGQATMANSSPVAIASDQTLPLPSGAATSAAQTTGNSSLSTIATNSSNIPVKGQALATGSTPVALAAPNIVVGNSFTSPHAASAYTTGQAVANSATAGSVTPITFTIAPGNGIPVYLLKAKLLVQTSGGAGATLTNGSFRLHIYGQSPTIAGGDGATFSTTLVNWCGSFDGTLGFQGTDYSLAEMVPTIGAFVYCAPAGGSQNIFGLLEVKAAFSPTTTNYVYQVGVVAQ